MSLEYRIVPRVWKYDSKVRIYQTKEQFERQSRGFPETDFRYEVREVGDWKPV